MCINSLLLAKVFRLDFFAQTGGEHFPYSNLRYPDWGSFMHRLACFEPLKCEVVFPYPTLS